MYMYHCIAIFTLVAIACAGPLQDYVNQPDPHFSYRYHSSFRGGDRGVGYTVINLNMTSQLYTVPGGVTPSLWTHWLSICIPDNIDIVRARTAHLHINGGFYNDPAPTTLLTGANGLVDRVCSDSRILSVQLMQIPEAPLVFGADPQHIPRVEDQILAFGWAEFLNHTDQPIWITRLAMVKAAVRAMDVIQEQSQFIDNCPYVEDFIISGASKRGWVAWLVPAVDNRIRAMIPMMMPILNMIQIINSEFRVYNGWPFALSDYIDQHIPAKLNLPVFHKLAAIEDPINYLASYNIPKLVITTTEDEFFLPDSPKYFWSQLPGEKHLNVINNADHDVDGDLFDDPDRFNYFANITTAFINQITLDLARPRYSWNLIYGNETATIEFQVLDGRIPQRVMLWKGTTVSAVYRDFRRYTSYCGDTNDYSWLGSVVPPTRTGFYTATVPKPPKGWTGFELEATYSTNGGRDTFKVTSNVNVVPDRYPFKYCYETNRCGDGIVNGGAVPASAASCPEFPSP